MGGSSASCDEAIHQILHFRLDYAIDTVTFPTSPLGLERGHFKDTGNPKKVDLDIHCCCDFIGNSSLDTGLAPDNLCELKCGRGSGSGSGSGVRIEQAEVNYESVT